MVMDVIEVDPVTEKMAYSAFELAKLSGCSESHIRRLMKSGEIPMLKLGERELVPAYWVSEFFGKPGGS